MAALSIQPVYKFIGVTQPELDRWQWATAGAAVVLFLTAFHGESPRGLRVLALAGAVASGYTTYKLHLKR